MTVTPSCPVLLVHSDDPFRQSLIVQLDRNHFSVTYTDDPAEAKRAVEQKPFKVIVVGVDLKRKLGLEMLRYLMDQRLNGTAVLIVGEPDPDLRAYAKAADETLLKPVDATYVADRARAYCGH